MDIDQRLELIRENLKLREHLKWALALLSALDGSQIIKTGALFSREGCRIASLMGISQDMVESIYENRHKQAEQGYCLEPTGCEAYCHAWVMLNPPQEADNA